MQIKTFNKDNVSNSLMTKVKKYINNPDFSFENVAKVCMRNLSCPKCPCVKLALVNLQQRFLLMRSNEVGRCSCVVFLLTHRAHAPREPARST